MVIIFEKRKRLVGSVSLREKNREINMGFIGRSGSWQRATYYCIFFIKRKRHFNKLGRGQNRSKFKTMWSSFIFYLDQNRGVIAFFVLVYNIVYTKMELHILKLV